MEMGGEHADVKMGCLNTGRRGRELLRFGASVTPAGTIIVAISDPEDVRVEFQEPATRDRQSHRTVQVLQPATMSSKGSKLVREAGAAATQSPGAPTGLGGYSS